MDRPEPLRLLKDARKGDVLLVESIDRLSRLPMEDWQKLKATKVCASLRLTFRRATRECRILRATSSPAGC